jgi:hypothetical protein
MDMASASAETKKEYYTMYLEHPDGTQSWSPVKELSYTGGTVKVPEGDKLILLDHVHPITPSGRDALSVYDVGTANDLRAPIVAGSLNTRTLLIYKPGLYLPTPSGGILGAIYDPAKW